MNASTISTRRLHLPGMPDVLVDERVEAMLAGGAAVSVSVSGGKDSMAAAIATARALEALGHRGERTMIHADLGVIEWADSLPACERTARGLGWDLLVARRAAGGLMERFEGRWRANVGRYQALESLRLVLPWSTSSMRLCTKELKVDVIWSALKKRFPTSDVVSVTGIRRAESPGRARRPVSAPDAGMSRRGLVGVTWNPILDWSERDVYAVAGASGIGLHEAYGTYGSSRVSCSFCILASAADLEASARCAGNHVAYRGLVDLERRSAFAFQGRRWLADVAPSLLDEGTRQAIVAAKAVAARREAAQARLPASLYAKGAAWPLAVPDQATAALIAEVRREVGEAQGLVVEHVDAEAVRERFAALIATRLAKEEGKG